MLISLEKNPNVEFRRISLKRYFIPCLCKNPFLVLQNGQKSVIKNQNLCSMGTNIQFSLPKRKLLESPYHIEDFTYLYHPHVVYTSYKNLWWKKLKFLTKNFNFETVWTPPLKEHPPFYYGGGGGNGGIFMTSKCKMLGLECRRKFKLVLAHIMDPSGPRPFGARTPPKSMCTHEAHPLEKKWSKMAIFGTNWRRMCLVSANHVGRACTPGMCQARSGAKNDGISAFLAPLER
jgi:hypothetical protein